MHEHVKIHGSDPPVENDLIRALVIVIRRENEERNRKDPLASSCG
jgi:hypothetical protein